MYRAVLILVLVATVWADDDKCRKARGPAGMHCCTEHPPPPDKDMDLKECFEMDHEPHTCAREKCIADKKGFHAGNGEVDKVAYEANIENNFKDDSELKQNIIQKCVKGDLSTYGPPDDCELMKIQHCTHFQIMAAKCNGWKDEGECSGMAELVKECS